MWDVDAKGRTAPDALGVLSHYDAAIWYTGDDIVTRTAGRGGGNADRLALDEMYEFRAFMNEGGKVMYTGNQAGMQYSGAPPVGTQLYDPQGEIGCARHCPPGSTRDGACGCADRATTSTTSCSTGSAATSRSRATGTTGRRGLRRRRHRRPVRRDRLGHERPESADNQDATSSFISTSGILPVAEFPQFESWPSARWDKPGGPFDPHTGEQYVYSQIADVSYKRLTRTVTVPAGGGTLDFWTSFDTEVDWDYVFVEARTPGGDDWTTLPDINGNTSQEHRRQLPRGVARAAPAARPLPDARRG